ncbi:ORF MSV119 putative RNA polymerase associated vaccinia RAP94 homolog (vaccinia H4L), similar to SW:P33067 [Melanoplus sanguinipes entomopoxvirus]|uniref:RNA polymerase-associated transcription-specificity factor RAP94 n=1 Tax=Melanoplus sanguinipes entomopoxvirus TaxID=83191 RepID=Q9YVX4_MSEPV|nr:ORF MSV119 putative RNA polymerase associated vaccinia RAP94 homolog (vaccinia H4L), similar to SW:P33067 [Melanoplus sanguinipes entomopoxvirus]AAC97801.1 ORF MSV119 putative RNA polymerase associated vaccinia RAP94 homolog (vaccinia H4L), similar to SW:P33067 [Melanoplus sanguinipes entomopoxvirus 'O']
MANQEKIIELITIMQNYIKKDNLNVNNFINEFPNEYNNYVLYNGIISDESYRFLFEIIKKNVNLAPSIVYNIFRLSQVSFDHNVYVSKIVSKKEKPSINKDIHTINYMTLLNNIFTIEAIPKFINLLWNVEKREENTIQEQQTDITTITKPVSRTKIIYISYNNLFDDFYINYEQYIFQKRYLIYDNLNRVIGVPLSSSNYQLNYIININLNNLNLSYNIYDTVSTKFVNIKGKGQFNLTNVKDIIQNTIDDIISYITRNRLTTLYERMFCLCYFLHCYYIRLFDLLTVYEYPLIEYKDYYNIYEPVKHVYKYIPCKHIDDYNIVFKEVNNFFNNYNAFIDKYIAFSNNLAICKICGESIDMFNFVEANYIQSHGYMIITTHKDNIFQYETYGKLTNAELFLSDYLSIYDSIFNTNVMDDFNNTARLIIDYMIHINNNRLMYQEEYKHEIDTSGLFFVRLTNNIFMSEYNEKEQFREQRMINIMIVIIITLVLVNNFNELIGIVKRKDMFKRIDFKKGINELIIEIVSEYIVKQGIDIKNLNIPVIINTYIKILTPELKSHYDILVLRFYNHIDILTMEEIIIYDFPMANAVKNTHSLLDLYTDKIPYVLELDNILTYENNINYAIKDKINISINSINIKNYKEFTSSDINIELKSLISEIKFEYTYKNTLVRVLKEIDNDIFYIDNSHKYFFNTNEIINESPFKIIGNEYFKLLYFSDPLPFLENINKKHLTILYDGINIFLNIYFPSYTFVDIPEQKYISREYYLYIFYNILVWVTNNKVQNFIYENKKNIANNYNKILSYYTVV